jgi:hypothetical protein
VGDLHPVRIDFDLHISSFARMLVM